jgi:hypothetical protein
MKICRLFTAHQISRRSILATVLSTFSALFVIAAPIASAQVTTTEKINIGIIGSGKVGSALGKAWLNAGHLVMFSSQHLEDDQALATTLGPNAHAGTPRDAAAFGAVVLIAVPYSAIPSLGKELGELLKGKIVIDASNPIVARDGEIAGIAREKGAGIASSEFLSGARIIRTFNAIPAAKMGAAAGQNVRLGMPMAGDDATAIQLISRLVRDVGYEPVIIGGLQMGKHLLPGTSLAGEHSPDELRKIAAELK